MTGVRGAEREILLASYFCDLDRDRCLRERHRKKPDAFALRSFLAIAATHDQNADGGSVGKRHRRRRASSVHCGLERFVGNLVLKSSITVVERFGVIIHARAPDLVVRVISE